MDLPAFAELAEEPAPRLDLLALSLAAAFGPVDAGPALAELDRLATLVEARLPARHTPEQEIVACAAVLGGEAGFRGDEDDYDAPRNSMLDVVLERRRGLPILLSVVYVEVARRAGVPLAGVGLPGHFVCGRFGAGEPLLLDPFRGGLRIGYRGPAEDVRPWVPREIAMRMLNNLVVAHARRGDGALAVRAAELRLPLAEDDDERAMLRGELRALVERFG